MSTHRAAARSLSIGDHPLFVEFDRLVVHILGWAGFVASPVLVVIGMATDTPPALISAAFAAAVFVLALANRIFRRYSAVNMCLFIMATFAAVTPFYPDLLQGAYLGLSLVFALFSVLLVDNRVAWIVAAGFTVIWTGVALIADLGVDFLIAMVSVVATLFLGVAMLGRAKEVLLGSEARYRALWDSVPVGLVASTVDGRILDINDALIQSLGAETKEAIVEHSAFQFWIDPDMRTGVMDALTTQGVISGVEIEVRRLDGSTYWCRVYGTQIVDTDNRLVNYFVSEDISDERTARETLEEVVRLKDRFLASVSHELRTPLAAIVGLSSEIRERSESLSTREIVEFNSTISNQADELALLVEDLLVSTRLEIGEVAIRAEDLNLVEVIDRAIDTFNAIAGLEIERIGHGRAYADPVRVRQIVRNLIANSHRAGASNITIRIDGGEDTTVLAVGDNGPGVPDHVRDAIFNAYVTGHHNEGIDRLGLGLYVSKALATRMGGDLTYRRDEGQSWFTLELPRNEPPPDEPPRNPV
ncbi:MAG: PAS domain-containing sensor histidine kinase [Acidimicrobiia bacterium]